MKWHYVVVALFLLGPTAAAQGLPQETPPPPTAVPFPAASPDALPDDSAPGLFSEPQADGRAGSPLEGNRNFPNFIGYMSNPLFAIDPRALTVMYPIFEATWTKAFPALPGGNIQLYGAGLNAALSDRLCVGLNQGGYAVSHFSDKSREGWLNLGGFVQYTLLEDVPNQFLLTAGLHWEAPTGEADVFQGHGPAKLAPYVTVGKECGDYHVLATTGYLFPTGSEPLSNLFYGTVHFDRRLGGGFYPLVEFNWAYHTTRVDLNVPLIPEFFSFGNFEGSGNIVSLAAGFNAVLRPNRLELGAVYITSIAAQNDFGFNGLLLKMILRY
jgi:hypothetical protein